MIKFHNVHIFILICFLLLSCKSDNSIEKNSDNNTTDEIVDEKNNIKPDSKEFYSLYYQKNIFPSIILVQQEIKKEIELINHFKNVQSDANFIAMQQQWVTCAKAYAKTRVYNFGNIKQSFYDLNIFNFPVNITAIETNIQEQVTFDTTYFNKKSSVTKGLGTLEYLIFHNNDTNKAISLMKDDNFRINYTLGIAKELQRQVNFMIATWENGYKNDFSNSVGQSCTQNARCLAFNQLINVLDITKVSRLGKPSGLEKSDNLAPETLEAFRSKSSLLLIEAMLEEVKYVYLNSDANFALIVNTIDDSGLISKEVNNTFNKLELSIDGLNKNLFDAINTDTKTIKPIYDALSELVILFAVDIASILSVTVLPTDNDGD